jgi:hypothetical protein
VDGRSGRAAGIFDGARARPQVLDLPCGDDLPMFGRALPGGEG